MLPRVGAWEQWVCPEVVSRVSRDSTVVIAGVVSPISTQMVISAACGYAVTQPEILERCHLSHKVFPVETGRACLPNL